MSNTSTSVSSEMTDTHLSAWPATCTICCGKILSASSCVVLMSSLQIEAIDVISTGGGSSPVITSLQQTFTFTGLQHFGTSLLQ